MMLLDQPLLNARDNLPDTLLGSVNDQLVPQAAQVFSNGRVVNIAFDEAISAPAGLGELGWTVFVQGSPFVVEGIQYIGSQVRMITAITIPAGYTVTVSYNATVGKVFSLASFLPLASFSNFPVTNNSLVISPVMQTAVIDTSGFDFTLTFSEPMTAASGQETVGMVLTVDGNVHPMTFAGFVGNTMLLDLGFAVKLGAVCTFDYTPGTMISVRGVPLAGIAAFPVTNQSTITNPVVETATVDTTGLVFTVGFSEPMQATPPEVAGITLRVNDVIRTVAFTSFTGNTMIMGVASTIAQGDAVTAQYDDTVGTLNAVATTLPLLSGGPGAVANNSTQVAPTFVSGALAADGLTLAFVFSTNIAAQAGQEMAGFDFVVGALVVPTTFVSIVGNTLNATSNATVAAGTILGVSYQLVTGSITNPANGLPMAGFLAQPVTNNSVQTEPTLTLAAVGTDGFTVNLTYNEAILAGAGQETAGFNFDVNGGARAITFVSIVGNIYTATFASVVAATDVVVMDYNRGQGTITSLTGVPAAAINNLTITNNSGQVGPTMQTAVVGANGTALTITYDINISATSMAGFTVYAAGAPITPTFVGPVGAVLNATLPTVVFQGQAVTMQYFGGNVVSAANPSLRAPDFAETAITNNSTQSTYSAEALAVFERMPTQAALTTAVKDAMAAFVDSQVAAGNWALIARFKCFFIASSLLTDQDNAMTDWLAGGVSKLQNGATWGAGTGVVFSGSTSNYLDTSIVPSSAGTQNNLHVSLKFGAVGNIVAQSIFGTQDSASIRVALETGANILTRPIVNSGSSVTVASPPAVGTNTLVSISRIAATDNQLRVDGAGLQTAALASTGLAGFFPLYVQGRNVNGSTTGTGTSVFNAKAFAAGAAIGFDYVAFNSGLATLCN